MKIRIKKFLYCVVLLLFPLSLCHSSQALIDLIEQDKEYRVVFNEQKKIFQIAFPASSYYPPEVLRDLKDQDKHRRLASFDSGGIRVIIPLYQCAALEYLSGKRIYELFDTLAGSGTGGIAAILLSYCNTEGQVLRASQILKIYTNYFAALYPKLPPQIDPSTGLSDVPKGYDVKNAKKIYKTMVEGSPFTPNWFKIHTLVMGYSYSEQNAFVMDTYTTLPRMAINKEDWPFLRVAEILWLSSLHPALVPPQLMPLSKQQSLIGDGTIPFPNPAMEAYHLLRKSFPKSTINIISFGTGSFVADTMEQEFCNHVSREMKCTPEIFNSLRLQPQISDASLIYVDNNSPDAISKLWEIGLEMIQTTEFQELCTLIGITKHWSAQKVDCAIRNEMNTMEFECLKAFTVNH